MRGNGLLKSDAVWTLRCFLVPKRPVTNVTKLLPWPRLNLQHEGSVGNCGALLESYGYKFVRINRFNVGENPISALNKRIADLVKAEPTENPLLKNIHQTIEGLQQGDMKECPKCKQVRTLQQFKDSSLITGAGRFCAYC